MIDAKFISSRSLRGALALACLGAALSACSDTSEIEDAVSESLIDPESARFGDVVKFETKDGDEGACVMVNAKNRMGGYTGERLYYALRLNDEGWAAMESPVQHGDCDWYISYMKFTRK